MVCDGIVSSLAGSQQQGAIWSQAAGLAGQLHPDGNQSVMREVCVCE